MFFKNTSGGTIANVLPGEVSLHPGPNGEYSVVRWTSPATGNINFSGMFGAGAAGLESYYIEYNGFTSPYLFKVYPPTSSDASFSFSSFGVSIGETIDFIVGGTYYSGQTPLRVTIDGVTPVPEPGTMMLLGSGLVGLFSYGRKRFKK